MESERGLYVLMMSIHGLVRGSDLELGRDADTGGQVTYVVELARALAREPQVARVDLLTRLVHARNVDSIYTRPVEQIAPKAYIVRVGCGPRRYLKKERLWPYLDDFADQTLQHIRRLGRVPDVIHGHYADAGYVGSELVGMLGVPLVFTGHSLGRVKKARLLAKGLTEELIESRYNMARRIEAEETALNSAALVIASTQQEVEEQYAGYDRYVPERMKVIPPGVDLSRFSPPQPGADPPPIAAEIDRFLRDARRPLILAMARPDERKNLEGLVRAFAENEQLRATCNLAIVAGSRDDINALDKGQRSVLGRLLYLFDLHDLYGQVAYPKHHRHDDVPDLYRLAASRRGVFVNPALTEPFGLTLIEAAASGLPVVATRDGGPSSIVAACQNGVLVDPLDTRSIGRAILAAVRDDMQWQRWSENGIQGAQEHFSWTSHARRYLSEVRQVAGGARCGRVHLVVQENRLAKVDRIVACNLDDVLDGDEEGLRAFLERMSKAPANVAFCVATGRGLRSVTERLSELGTPKPQILITAAGTEIHYGPLLARDRIWERQIAYGWQPDAVREVLDRVDGLTRQDEAEQHRFKISYDVDSEQGPSLRSIVQILRRAGLAVRVLHSHGVYLDVVPVRAGPGRAIRHLGFRWGIPPERMLVAGVSGVDERMLRGNTLGVVVANRSPELERLRGLPRVLFARGHHAFALVEGIDHYDFFGRIRIPEPEAEAEECVEEELLQEGGASALAMDG
ncbi:MAG: glycosyltransferase [Planctomycetes bacterium]|nr:glycosyltransferase [Planctomycetota bacterium]